MNSEELEQEVEAIEAIYDGSIQKLADGIVKLHIPNHPDFSAQLAFPSEYPEVPPSLIQVITRNGIKYPDDEYLYEKMQGILERVFQPQEVVMFELIGEMGAFLDDYDQQRQQKAACRELEIQQKAEEKAQKEAQQQRLQSADKSAVLEVDHTKGWVQSEPIVDRASTFVAFAREVHSTEQAQRYISDLTSDRKISRAAHNMVAMRIIGENGVSYQDCDDDGETAAGSRMLHLLTIMDAQNVVVVVTRWFGGIHLGSARFKHINSATRDALTRGSFCGKK